MHLNAHKNRRNYGKNKIILVHQTLEVEQRQSEAASWLPWWQIVFGMERKSEFFEFTISPSTKEIASPLGISPIFLESLLNNLSWVSGMKNRPREPGEPRIIVLPKFCHMLKISQPIITLMSPYLQDKTSWLDTCARCQWTQSSCTTEHVKCSLYCMWPRVYVCVWLFESLTDNSRRVGRLVLYRTC